MSEKATSRHVAVGLSDFLFRTALTESIAEHHLSAKISSECILQRELHLPGRLSRVDQTELAGSVQVLKRRHGARQWRCGTRRICDEAI